MTRYNEEKSSLRETNLDRYLRFRQDLVEGICKAFSRNPRANKHDFDVSVDWLNEHGFFDKPSKMREGRLADIKYADGYVMFKSQEDASKLAVSIKEEAAREAVGYVESQFDMFAEECQEDSAAELSVETNEDANTTSFLLNGKVAFSFYMPPKALKYKRYTAADGDEGEIVDDATFAQDLMSGKVASCPTSFGNLEDFMFTERAVYAYYLVVTDFQRTWGMQPGDVEISTPTLWKGDIRKSPYSGYDAAIAYIANDSEDFVHLLNTSNLLLPSVDSLFDRIKLDNTLLSSFDSIPSQQLSSDNVD